MLHIDVKLIIKLLNLGNHGIHTINSGISCVSDQRLSGSRGLSWSLQRGSLRTMSLSWKCSQDGEWTRTVGSTSGRIMQNMNSSGNRWLVCVLYFYCWLDPFCEHDCNHWVVHFIIVGLFPRSHGFYNPWNKWVRGSFPAHTGIGYFRLWCSFTPCLTTRRLFFYMKICIVLLHTSQTFLKSSSCPEIHGHLHAKELSRKSWKKLYFILRRSGLYFSNKGTSKVRRNTRCCFFC